MDAHHSKIDWAASTARDLSPKLREGLADLWRRRMVSEHRSIGIFNLYTLDLLGAGAPAEVLSLACRAALDEVRHTELFARLTEIYSGKKESPPPGIPALPDEPDVPIRKQVAREALHLCVCSESYSAASLGELYARAQDPTVRAVLGVVLSDEIYHARMGWAVLASMYREPDGEELRAHAQSEIPATFDNLARELFGDLSALAEPSLAGDERRQAEAHGYLSLRDDYVVFQSLIEAVWIPGLLGLGLDPSSLRGRFPILA